MRTLETAEILAVGSELLTPHRIDTNSLFLTGRLNEFGIGVRTKSIVGDDRDDLAALLRAALGRADVVILTGGLGPTDDDITREVVAGVLDRGLVEDREVLAHIAARFQVRGVVMPSINARQALVPTDADVLANPHGTAPGLLLKTDDDRLVILLPGPPRELQPMFESHLAPLLEQAAGGRRLRRRVIKVTGRSESQVEEVAQPIYTRLGCEGVRVETTILAAPGQIELHLSSRGADVTRIDAVLEAGVQELAAALGTHVFSLDGRSLEQVVGSLLAERGWWLAAAESCTGGLLLGRLTDVPGSSGWVRGGIIAYDNAVKVSELGVPAALLEAHGAVSEPVAAAMAEGVRLRLGVQIGVGVTGIAGPGGGSALKPVGTVAIAVVTGDGTSVRTWLFPGDREVVRRFATTAALDMVRRHVANPA